jgi:ribonuclease-3
VPDLDAFQNRIGYRFRRPELLELALTHSSVVLAAGRPAPNNQRLEFLGDAVIQLALTRHLYDRFADHDEGSLTKSRAHLVNRRTLAEQAAQIGLGSVILLSRAEEANAGRERPSILSNAYESVIGAIFLDGGYDVARDFVLAQFASILDAVPVAPQVHNPKGDLQEYLQIRSPHPPTYRILSASGPDHDRAYECAVFHNQTELGRGTGKSKQKAETAAAANALLTIRNAPTPEAKTDTAAN